MPMWGAPDYKGSLYFYDPDDEYDEPSFFKENEENPKERNRKSKARDRGL